MTINQPINATQKKNKKTKSLIVFLSQLNKSLIIQRKNIIHIFYSNMYFF